MTNPRKLALLATAVTALGLAGLAWTGTLGQASKAQAPHDDHGQDSHGHAAEQAAAGPAEEGHGEEEGQLHLSVAQIETAGVQLAAAGPRELGTAISFPGEIRFDEDRTAHVVPRVPGVVEAVQAELGQAVRRGQVLAVIASQQISDLRSEQQAAQRRLELARLTFQREQQLWQERISAEQDYLQARQTLQEAEIALANARQKVAAVGPAGAGNRYELRAPFDAVVVEKHLTVGEVVDATSNAFTLSDLSRVWATFAVAPRDLDKVVTGRDVRVSAPGGGGGGGGWAPRSRARSITSAACSASRTAPPLCAPHLPIPMAPGAPGCSSTWLSASTASRPPWRCRKAPCKPGRRRPWCLPALRKASRRAR